MQDGTYKRTENVIAKHPGQMLLWDWEANVGVDPSVRGARSSQTCFWRCPVADDHRWSAPPSVITRSLEKGLFGCPFCAGRRLSVTSNFATRYPEGAALWHPTRNGDLRPQDVLAGSSERVWWRCLVGPDHEWQAAPIVIGKMSLAKGNSGCPFCAGKRPSMTNSVASHPELLAEWHPTRNEDSLPETSVAGGQRKYWWLCRSNPDHEWEASVGNRVRGRGCPFCSKSLRSVLEVGLAYELRGFFPDLDLDDDKVLLNDVVTQVDILIRSIHLVIEVDGRFHHTKGRYPLRDKEKSSILVAAGYRIIRVREAPLERVNETDVMMPQDPTIKETADAVLARIRELSWASLDGLEAYLDESEPRHWGEALVRLQRDRPGKRFRLPGPVIMPKHQRWERSYRLVEQFAKREGHARVPDDHVEDGIELGSWVGTQRRRQSRGVLERDRVARLQSLPGWSWSAVEDQWEDGYEHLVAYLKREGHIDVPAHYWASDGFPLGSWVRSHRRRGGRRTISGDQQQRLEALPGWTYAAPYQSQWETARAAMDKFADREGHCRTPLHHREDGVDIDSWSKNQRVRYHKGKLAMERVISLEEIPGRSWRPQEAAWERGFEALQAVVDEEGTAAVRRDLEWEGYPVGAWVGEQRNRRLDLPGTLRERLEALPGWTWAVHADSWDRHVDALATFVEREGHAAVPTGHKERGVSLGSWVIRNRAEYRQGSLVESRIAQLQAFPGWIWDPLAERWERSFAQLVRFVERNGHARVPMTELSNGLPLGHWVVAQRQSRKNDQLDADREARLASLPGWAWDIREALWEDGFAALIRHKERTGHCDVPRTWVEDGFKLGQWLGTQRNWKKTGRLRPDREARLAELVGSATLFGAN